ncbi:MAG: hypothetical protein KGQ28_04490, partial [Hyphomicrobiales bacterium]|nr:hypothetical protein [Hyphomicrobiales bacterium]
GSWHFPLKRAPGAPAPGDAKAANAEAEARLAALTHGAGAVAAGCARRYRAAYSLSFALGAAGAAAVAAATAFPVRRRAAAIELAAVALVVAISGLAAWRQWHRRWLEAREVAERLRSSAPFWPLGIWPQAPSDEQPRWTGWFVRAAIRELPVFSGDLGAEMPEVRARASALVAGQLAYHRDRIARRSRRDALFKWMGYACLAGGAALAAADLADAAFSSATPARATSVLLPALGATLFGLRLFSGAEDEVRRSERCVGELAGLERAFADDAPGDLETLRARVRDLERVMSSDVEVWRAVYESRRLGAA